IIDITERKRAEERFRLVVEASPNAIIMIDGKGSITLVNTQTEQLFGYKRAELLSQPMEMLVPERYRKGHPGHREDFFARPSTRDELLDKPIEELVPQRFRAAHSGYREGFASNPSSRPMGAGRNLYGLRKDGSEFPVEIGLNPLETDQGMMVLCTIVDIAERK